MLMQSIPSAEALTCGSRVSCTITVAGGVATSILYCNMRQTVRLPPGVPLTVTRLLYWHLVFLRQPGAAAARLACDTGTPLLPVALTAILGREGRLQGPLWRSIFTRSAPGEQHQVVWATVLVVQVQNRDFNNQKKSPDNLIVLSQG